MRHDDYRQYVRDWMLMYKEWRELHLHQTKAWRGKRVRGCWNKIPYEKYIDAERVRFHMPPREHVLLVVYLCKLCGKYHTGNSRGEYYRQVVTKDTLTTMQASPILNPAVERNPSMTTLIPCDSTLVAGYFYDDATWVLAIQFRGTGEVRIYAEFPPELYDDFEKAKSKGQFFNAHIAKKFPVQKSGVTVDNAPAKAVAADPALDADIAAQEAEWGRKGVSPVGSHQTVVIASEMADWPTGELFPSSAMPKAEQVPNGFDAGGGFASERLKVEQEAPANPMAEVLPPEAELPKKNDAQITALTAEAKALAAKPIIVTAATYQDVYSHVADMVARRKRIFEFLDPVREAMYRAYSLMLGRQKEALEPLDNAIKAGKQALLAYDQEQDRKRREAQRIADEAASRAAEVERLRIQEELTLAEVGDALAVGDTEKAEELMATPIEVAPIQAYAPRVMEYQAPVVAGKSTRKNWKGEVVDLDALILDVAEGIKHFLAKGNLGGHAPSTFLVPNGTALNQEAKSKESKFNYPGCRAFNDSVMSVRSR